MAKRNKNSNMVTLYAELNKNIPAQRNALEILEEYQEQTGLSKKDALVFMLVAFGQLQGKWDFLQLPLGSFSFEEKQMEAASADKDHTRETIAKGRKSAQTEHRAKIQEEELLSPDLESFLDENMGDFL